MRVPLRYNAITVPVDMDNQNVLAPFLPIVEIGLTSSHQVKRRCRLCDPASGQCRHLCVRKASRPIK